MTNTKRHRSNNKKKTYLRKTKKSSTKKVKKHNRKFNGGTGPLAPYSAQQNFWQAGVLRNKPNSYFSPPQISQPMSKPFKFNLKGGYKFIPSNMPVNSTRKVLHFIK